MFLECPKPPPLPPLEKNYSNINFFYNQALFYNLLIRFKFKCCSNHFTTYVVLLLLLFPLIVISHCVFF